MRRSPRKPRAPYAISAAAWAITYPVGHYGESRIDVTTIRGTRSRAIADYLAVLGNGNTWQRRRRNGERCVIVVIRQEKTCA